MNHKALAALILVTVLAAAWAANPTFTLRPEAGVKPTPTGITQAKFPSPSVARDPLVYPWLEFDVADYQDVPAAGSVAAHREWRASKLAVRADTIIAVAEVTSTALTPEYEGYLLLTIKDSGREAIFVRGSLAQVEAIIAQTTGSRVVAVSFDEAR